MGIFLATIAGSMPQFGLLLMLVLFPLQILAGGLTPVENMPAVLRTLMSLAPDTSQLTLKSPNWLPLPSKHHHVKSVEQGARRHLTALCARHDGLIVCPTSPSDPRSMSNLTLCQTSTQ